MVELNIRNGCYESTVAVNRQQSEKDAFVYFICELIVVGMLYDYRQLNFFRLAFIFLVICSGLIGVLCDTTPDRWHFECSVHSAL